MTSTSSATDKTQDNLRKIEHFVVLMLENRSFDQMLGHLELEGHDVDGVKRTEDKPLTRTTARRMSFTRQRGQR